MPIDFIIRDFWPAKNGECRNLNLGECDGGTCPSSVCHPDFEYDACTEERGAIGAYLDDERKPFLLPGSKKSFNGANWFKKWFRNDPVNRMIKKTVDFQNTNSNQKTFSYSSNTFFPIEGEGYGDFTCKHVDRCNTRSQNYHFTTEVNTRFRYNGGEVFEFEGDDDVWVFIDKKLVLDIGGCHGAIKESFSLDSLNLTKNENYALDMFHAERKCCNSNFRATTTLALYCAYYDHCGVCNGLGETCCECDDQNSCTSEKCDVMNGTCIYTQESCESDGNLCTEQYCDSGAASVFDPAVSCKTRDVECSDNKVCTRDTCDPENGCQFFPVECEDDNDVCTTTQCVEPDGCVTSPRDTCDDNDACTTDNCDAQSGCSNKKIDCDDGKACTIDTCDKNIGCVHTLISCDDGLACTIDSCSNSTGCVNEADSCDDGLTCTLDSCSEPNGCSHEPNPCDDDNECTTDSCTEEDGCVNTRIICNDGLTCTTDSCDPQAGCQHEDIVDCNQCEDSSPPVDADADPCNPYVCDPATGDYTRSPVNCDDNNECTTDTCVVSGNSAVCKNTAISCGFHSNLCETLKCDRADGICKVDTIKTCSDGNKCTVDTCNPDTGMCVYEPKACDTSNKCRPEQCNRETGICEENAVTCSNNNPCNVGECQENSGECSFSSRVCPSDDPCFPASCNRTHECFNTKFVDSCVDNNACTVKSCEVVNGSPRCRFDRIVCDDQDPCTIDSCDRVTGCFSTKKVCNDNNKCTTDTCNSETGECQFTRTRTNVTDLCITSYCDPAVGHVSSPVKCFPEDSCRCEKGECVCDDKTILGIDSTVAGIGLGAIAAISAAAVVGALIVGAGGKKGYDYIRAKHSASSNVQENPLYEQSMNTIENPFFEEDEGNE